MGKSRGRRLSPQISSSQSSSPLPAASAASEATQTLLHASLDAMINPHALLEAVRDPDGRVADFIFRSVNRAALAYLELTEDQLIGSRALRTLGSRDGPGLLSRFADCMEDGEPVIIDDFPYVPETVGQMRRYDVRANRAGPDLLAMTWSDVTERFQFVERIAASEKKYRRSIDTAAVGMCLITPEGRFEDVNEALCQLLGYDADSLKQKTWRDFNAPGFGEEGRKIADAILAGSLDSYRTLSRFVHADGHLIWGDLSVSCVRGDAGNVEYFISQITDVTALVEANERNRALAEQLQRQTELIAASEQRYRLLAENAGDVVCHTRGNDKGENIIVWISPNVDAALGAPAEHWLGRALMELIPAEDTQAHAARWQKVLAGGVVSQRVRMSSVDGVMHWFHVRINPYYDDAGQRDGAVIAAHLVDDEVAAEHAAEEARRDRAKADELFRRSMENAAVGMCVAAPDGRFSNVNEALCRFFGYDAETLRQMSDWQLTAPAYADADIENISALTEGRIDSYRMTKQYKHADGHLIWADLSVSCIRDESGAVESYVGQILDITAQVEANDRVRMLAQRLQLRTDAVTEELGNAATYMTSILPHGLTGRVTVKSRYLPSSELGGDVFDYRWIDDNHLLVYLADVSGHGIAPALLAASVLNMLRFGNIAPANLLQPDTVLAELNRRFQMEQHGYHYFTMWCGVYEVSSRTLRYANAGAPAALAFSSASGSTVTVTELTTDSAPVGMFEDTAFALRSYTVPPGCQILIYSDGASEIALSDDRQLLLREFKNLTSRLAQSPDWSLDGLIEELHTLTPSDLFEDDCSLIQLAFD